MLVLALAANALASSLNPWGSATSPGTGIVAPYVYVYPDAATAIVYGSAALGGHGDVYVGAGATIPRHGDGAAAVEVFPRWFVDPSVALVAHLYWTPGTDGVVLAPEVHVAHTWTRFAITANLGWKPILSTSPSVGSAFALVAPELRPNPQVSLFVELDPTVSLTGDPASLVVAPGVSFAFDPGAHDVVVAAVQIPSSPEVAPASLGVSFTHVFATSSPEKPAP